MLVYASVWMYLISIILTMVPVTYEAVTIATYYDSGGVSDDLVIREPVLFYTFGRDLFFGWFVSCLTFVIATVLCFSSKLNHKKKYYDMTTDSNSTLLSQFI